MRSTSKLVRSLNLAGWGDFGRGPHERDTHRVSTTRRELAASDNGQGRLRLARGAAVEQRGSDRGIGGAEFQTLELSKVNIERGFVPSARLLQHDFPLSASQPFWRGPWLCLSVTSSFAFDLFVRSFLQVEPGSSFPPSHIVTSGCASHHAVSPNLTRPFTRSHAVAAVTPFCCHSSFVSLLCPVHIFFSACDVWLRFCLRCTYILLHDNTAISPPPARRPATHYPLSISRFTHQPRFVRS
jgi:hypothetical protein